MWIDKNVSIKKDLDVGKVGVENIPNFHSTRICDTAKNDDYKSLHKRTSIFKEHPKSRHIPFTLAMLFLNTYIIM